MGGVLYAHSGAWLVMIYDTFVQICIIKAINLAPSEYEATANLRDYFWRSP